jgi:hypothetical protein
MNALMLTLALLAAPQSEKKEAKWLTKYQEAVQLAAREGKPLVIDGSREG